MFDSPCTDLLHIVATFLFNDEVANLGYTFYKFCHNSNSIA